jgi:predicted permease
MFKYHPWKIAEDLSIDQMKEAAFDIQLSIAFLMAVLFLTALAVVFLIPHQAGARPRDPAIRRFVYWVLCLVVPLFIFPAYIWGCLHLFGLDNDERNAYVFWTPIVAVLAVMLTNGIGYLLGRTTLRYSKLVDVFTSQSRR